MGGLVEFYTRGMLRCGLRGEEEARTQVVGKSMDCVSGVYMRTLARCKSSSTLATMRARGRRWVESRFLCCASSSSSVPWISFRWYRDTFLQQSLSGGRCATFTSLALVRCIDLPRRGSRFSISIGISVRVFYLAFRAVLLERFLLEV
jgi:hypothetical protein